MKSIKQSITELSEALKPQRAIAIGLVVGAVLALTLHVLSAVGVLPEPTGGRWINFFFCK